MTPYDMVDELMFSIVIISSTISLFSKTLIKYPNHILKRRGNVTVSKVVYICKTQ